MYTSTKEELIPPTYPLWILLLLGSCNPRRCRTSSELSDEGSTHQCPLLWTWVLEKMGMLEVAKRLTDKQHRDTRFTQVQALGGKPYSCLSALDYGGTEGYMSAQMRSGERCAYEVV